MDTPVHITQAAKHAINSLLPEKSSSRYWKEYESFVKWCTENLVASNYNEHVLLAYFDAKSKNLKSSTLWSMFSMLKSTLNIKHDNNIANYLKLIAFLKRTKDKYIPKKSKVLEMEEIEKFLNEAPNEEYLMIKAALIIGMCAACRRHELSNLKVENIKNRGDVIVINICDTKTNKPRSACITEPRWIEIINKYMSLRPETEIERFFLFYSKNKCTRQPVGIHTFGNMPYKIASFLKLDNPKQFTGHCFRRSSATALAGRGADITTLKRLGGWKSTSVADWYIEDSLKAKVAIANQLAGRTKNTNSLSPQPSTSSTYTGNVCSSEGTRDNIATNSLSSGHNLQIKLNDGSSANINISNLQNCTVNFNLH